MGKPSIIIAGAGIVGRAVQKDFPAAMMYDPYVDALDITKDAPRDVFDFCFICVPTPSNADGSANISAVEDVLAKIRANIYIVKSTVPPGTIGCLAKIHQANCIFSPEYTAATQNGLGDPDFVILGGARHLTDAVATLYARVKPASFKIAQVPSNVAELCKYMVNSFLAMKVVFCATFARACLDMTGSRYSVLRELFTLDPRIGRSHTFIDPAQLFYDSHCFNKDLPAIIAAMETECADAAFLRSIVDANERYKSEQGNA